MKASPRTLVAVPREAYSYLAVGIVTAATATFVSHGWYWLLPLSLGPLALLYGVAFRNSTRREGEDPQTTPSPDLQNITIEALARATDAEPQPLSPRSRQLQRHATRLAQALRLTDSEVQAIAVAAALQDIGKRVGAWQAMELPLPDLVSGALLSRHERWDGTGQPQGLERERIPIGGRILALASHFTALTSETPHRKAVGPAEAIELLRREAGEAFDPRLVATYTGLLPSLLADAGDLQSASVATPTVSGSEVSVPSHLDESRGASSQAALAQREIDVLYEIAQGISASLDVADTMTLISTKLSAIVPWSGCSLFLRTPPSNALQCVYASGLEASRLLNRTLPWDLRGGGWMAGELEIAVNADPHATFNAAGVTGHIELASALHCPLVADGTMIGILSLYHAEVNRYAERHQRLIERIADQAATVLHNSLVFERTREDARTDALTSLPNRRWVGIHVSQELERAERTQAHVAVMLLDIDDFKTINDSFGHNVGDRALREAAKALTMTCRPYDLCARYAGDEFILVLPDCTREVAESRREELEKRLGDIAIQVWPHTVVRLRASAGVSVFPEDGRDFETLVATADQRMYRDKAQRTRLGLARPESSLMDAPLGGGNAVH